MHGMLTLAERDATFPRLVTLAKPTEVEKDVNTRKKNEFCIIAIHLEYILMKKFLLFCPHRGYGMWPRCA